MKQTLTLLVFGLLAVLVLAGCPRDTGNENGDSSANLEGRKPDFTEQQDADTAPDAATEADAGNDMNADDAGDAEAVEDGEAAADEDTEAETGDEVDADAADDTEAAGEKQTADLEPEEGVINVLLETTKGDIVLAVHEDWSPLGAAHFLELVNAGFYNGAPWFRVMGGFVAQCGIAADSELHQQWMYKTINDEPVVQGNLPGYVAFGKTRMPNSRSTHIFINLADNTNSLDPQGFSCFAKVVEGMDVAYKLYKCQGDQGSLVAPGGIDRFKTRFPDADYILKASVMK